MKQKMKHLVSFIAVLVMLVSLCSAMVFPAAAADEYETLLNTAFVVNPSWSGLKEGTPISFQFRGKTINDVFDADFYFASFDDAWAHAKELKLSNPTILLTEGTYTTDIKLDGGVTLLGPNAGITPNVKSNDKKSPWTKAARNGEAVLQCNIYIYQKAVTANVTIDGLTFGEGSAYLDYLRNLGESELVVKNTVFATEGNAKSYNYVFFMRSSGHARTMRMENIYVSGYGNNLGTSTPAYSFIAPYFSGLYVKNLAYVDCPIGFLAKTWFADGVSPVIEIDESCFYNADPATPKGYVISVDNAATHHDFISAKADVNVTSADGRPSSLLQVNNSVFYNASAPAGVIRFELINRNSVVDLQNNYIYSENLTTVVTPEYLIDSGASDQTDCFIFRKNVMLNSYLIPTIAGSGNDTHINMSQNFFGDKEGNCIYIPVYVDPANGRLIRTEFYVTPELNQTNLDARLSASNWPLVWVDNQNYSVDILAFETSDLPFAPVFEAGPNYDVQLYKDAKEEAGVVSGLIPGNKIDSIKLSDLKIAPDNTATLYLNAQPKDASNTFTPTYKINLQVIGDISGCKSFAEAFPGYFMVNDLAAQLEDGAVMPFRWEEGIYRFTVGENLFATVGDAIAYANANGNDNPTICLPAGVYTSDIVITGSCTILGAQHGVNPNVKPYEVLTREVVDNSEWSLNPARSNDVNETLLNACLRVDPAADDYVITVDGIKMGEGCSYVDDISRNASNVTILKNILADKAGGGFNRAGGINGNIFNFSKEYGVGTEYTTVYMYDIRVVNVNYALIGPLIEKLVVDGLFIGNNKKNVWNDYRSRDVEAPLFSWTNCYFGPNASGTSGCFFNTAHQTNNLAVMKQIVYFWDNNVFYNAFPTGGYINCQFTGTNMTVYVTNNTVVSDHADSFFCNTAYLRMHGDCKTQDTSNMIVMKGNHMINYVCMTRTYGTAPGTMWDFSGNYYADNTKSEIGFDPAKAYKIIHNAAGYTLEEATRCKIDYTFMDWDMTQRSDATEQMKAEYTITKDPAKFANYVYTDTIPGNLSVYPRPYEVGEYCKEVIYLDANKNYTAKDLDIVAAMQATGETETVKFYIDVVTLDGIAKESFTIALNRTPNTEAEVLSYENGLVSANKINVASGLMLYYYPEFAVGTGNTLSINATYEYFADEDLTEKIENIGDNPAFLVNPAAAYLKVTSEDGETAKVYSINVNCVKEDNQLALVGVTGVEGMDRVSETAFETTVSKYEKSYKVKPIAFRGSSLKLTDASGKVIVASAGTYTLDLSAAGNATYTLTATSGNGQNTATYTLTVKRGLNNSAEILGVEGARRHTATYALSFGLSDSGVIKAQVAPGAKYEVFYDYACTQKCEGGIFTVTDKETDYAYIKATSEDGTATARAKVIVLSQAGNINHTILTAKVGDKTYEAISTGANEYTIQLPAGVESTVLKGVIMKSKNETFANFYADPSYGTMIKLADDNTSTIKLEQKKTAVYVLAPMTQREAVDKDENPILISVPERRTTLYIISDRKATTYTDAAKIAKWAQPYVNYLNEGKFGIMKGDDKGNFNATNEITRYEISAMACRVLGLDVSHFNNATLSYADSVATWAKPYVAAATAAGLMNGSLDSKTGTISFEGSKKATREQVMKILVSICLRADGIAQDPVAYYTENAGVIDAAYTAPGGAAFADEKKVSAWAKPYVRMAVGKYQMINGELKNGQYYLNPKNNITRAEVTKMVACYLGYQD